LFIFNLGLVLDGLRFQLRQLVSEQGFSCSFPIVISYGRSTGDENRSFNHDDQSSVKSDGDIDNNYIDVDK